MTRSNLKGIYAAAVTPLTAAGEPDLDGVPVLLDFLARRGCHGALLLGTTGEGPSFSTGERLSIFKVALQIRRIHPEFKLLAGTGCPSLEETIALTRGAFELGFEGVVSLPPYYFMDATEDGLFQWFSTVLDRAVPPGLAFLGYHIPAVSGVTLSIDLLSRLKDAHPDQFAGLKDSSGDPAHARELGRRFGESLIVLVGNDRLLQESLIHNGAGCITAAANLFSGYLRAVWDAYYAGVETGSAHQKLLLARQILEEFRPFPPAIKAVLASQFGLGPWPVRPPLVDLSPAISGKLHQALTTASLFD